MIWNFRVKVAQTERGNARGGATIVRRFSRTSWLKSTSKDARMSFMSPHSCLLHVIHVSSIKVWIVVNSVMMAKALPCLVACITGDLQGAAAGRIAVPTGTGHGADGRVAQRLLQHGLQTHFLGRRMDTSLQCLQNWELPLVCNSRRFNLYGVLINDWENIVMRGWPHYSPFYLFLNNLVQFMQVM